MTQIIENFHGINSTRGDRKSKGRERTEKTSWIELRSFLFGVQWTCQVVATTSGLRTSHIVEFDSFICRDRHLLSSACTWATIIELFYFLFRITNLKFGDYLHEIYFFKKTLNHPVQQAPAAVRLHDL